MGWILWCCGGNIGCCPVANKFKSACVFVGNGGTGKCGGKAAGGGG